MHSPLRKYADPAPAIAEDWFKKPIQNIAVRKLGDFSPTADGACRVEFSNGRVGYVKPRAEAENLLLVAREKIVADIGYVLGLPVAPVVIRQPQPTDWPFYSVMSLACLPAARPWSHAPQPGARDNAIQALEGLRVFWTWIADNDHSGNPGNLLFEARGTSCQVMSIDHAHALCHSCDPNNPLATPPCHGYDTSGHSEAEVARKPVASLILSSGMKHAEPIVRRLEDILTFDEQNRILQILEARLEMMKAWTE